MANLISDWHRSRLRITMKSHGIRFGRAPSPRRLYLLPCNYMVLSAILLTMHAVAMHGHSLALFSTLWLAPTSVERVTVPHTPSPRPPPDPDPPAPDAPSSPTVVAQEGEADGVKRRPEESEDPTEASSWESFKIITGCTMAAVQAFDLWNDLGLHVQECLLSCHHPSFGPIGLLADDEPPTAIVDTGASLTITHCKDDFVTYQPTSGGKVLKGLVAGAPVDGVGVVEWIVEVGNKTVSLKLRALHVPSAGKRLLCPQQLHQELYPGMPDSTIGRQCLTIELPEGPIECRYNDSNLPLLLLAAPKETTAELHVLHACLSLEKNQNLTVSQKELLKWHTKFGHCDLRRVQKIMKTGSLGQAPIIRAAANCDLNKNNLLCGSCAYGKAKRRHRRAKTAKDPDNVTKPEPPQEKLLSKEVLIPGQRVSMDHFICSTPGRLFSSRGREPSDRMYKGGVIFVDHASGYVHVEPVVNFTAGEALRAKRTFEQEMLSMGVTVLNYHADNGIFTASEYQDELAKMGQNLTLSGVGAHHQNAMAERMIGVTVSMARTMMLHAKLRWPKAVKTQLWPMALKHSQHLHNHLPNLNNVCPIDLVLRTSVPRNALRELHVWGSPCYVLDPKLQDGGHIPKFDARSRQGMNLGWSPKHAATVPLILNLTTGHVSPQYHVLFDDWFSTVDSSDQSSEDAIESQQWEELFDNGRFQVAFDDDDPIELDDEWLTKNEQLEKHQRASARVQANQRAAPKVDIPKDEPKDQAPPIEEQERPIPPVVGTQPSTPTVATRPGAMTTRPGVKWFDVEVVGERPKQREPFPKQREPFAKEPFPPSKQTPDFLPSRRARPQPGYFKGMVASMIAELGNNVALSAALQTVGSSAAHLALQGFDAVTETFDFVECHTYQALVASKTKGKKGMDPDYPNYNQAMAGPDAEEWLEAMRAEIEILRKMNTWTVVPRQTAIQANKPIIKTTWAFRQKRNPMGEATKKKSRWCVRGDIQKRMEDIESFSPVVQWSSVRLLLILSIVHGLQTRQVDYVNAFAQADLDKEVYIEPPQGFKDEFPDDVVLRLNKSLYGMTDAPLIFFELLKKNLKKVGFQQIEHLDPCLFVHKKAICLTYVDDCLWFGIDGNALDKLIQEMKDTGMDLTIESNDVSAFLGIQFTRKGETIELNQTGLIDKIIETVGMQDANPAAVPAEVKPLGKDKNGAHHSESWNYRSVVGMLLYVAGNSRPDIAFAVHQTARFSHDPRQSHSIAIKRIVRYLIGTREKGMIFRPTKDWKIDCFVDADFCGLWGSEDPDDPIVSKSRTGYIVTLAGCPLLWSSKLQTETSVSTMMAEYVALSAAMREMLPLKRLVKAVAKVVTGDDNVQMLTKSDVFEDNNGALTVATLPRITPQSKFFAVKLHFFKEHVKTEENPEGDVEIHKICTSKQLADIMTKGLVKDKFEPLRDALMGWDLNEDGRSELFANLHSRGSVGNVSMSVRSNQPLLYKTQSTLYALVCSLEYDKGGATLMTGGALPKTKEVRHLWKK